MRQIHAAPADRAHTRGARTKVASAVVKTPRRSTVLCALLCLVSFIAFWLAQRVADVSMIDVMVYRAQGEAVRDGTALYALRATHADLPATYPPFAALLFVPLTLVDVPTMRFLATAGNLLLLVAVVHLSLLSVGRPARLPRRATALAVSAVAVWCEPVWTTLRYGQINLLLTALVLWDLTRRPGHRLAGIGVGVAAGVKLTPALFVVFLALAGSVEAWRRSRTPRGPKLGAALRNHLVRRAAVATGAFLVTVVAAAAVLPDASRLFWTEVLFRADRVGNMEDTANQSLHGLLARALHTGEPGTWPLALSAATAVVGLGIAVTALLAGPRLPYATAWGTTACAATALLISPVSWSHHWVWCVPVAVLLGVEALARGRRSRWAAMIGWSAVFCSYALWWVPHSADRADRLELRQSAWEMALSAVYPATGAAFLGLVALTALSARRAAPYGRAATVVALRPPAAEASAAQAVTKQ